MNERERFERIKAIFQEAFELPREERSACLDKACAGDDALRREVERMLAEHDTATATSDGPGAGSSGTPPGSPVHSPPGSPGGSGGGVPPSPLPERIGPYRILHEIGRGGMGVVYLALKDGDRFKRRLALKVVKGEQTPESLHRFELEKQVLGAMNHPGVARLYDAGITQDGRPWFAMEHVEGQPIDTYCDARKLNTAQRLDLFTKVCEAVHYAHQNLVVHRDLKPGHIVITPDGQPKLLDFGIAKLLDPVLSLLAEDYTAPEKRVMTPRYASPEQVRGAPIGTASDIYSLGVVLYELLTGHAPYRLASRMQKEMERVICEVDPERPSTAISRVEEVPDATSRGTTGTQHTVTPESVSRTREGRPDRLRRRLAGDIDNIVLMAMRKEEQRRYRSAEQFAEDIQRHLGGMPVIARPDTWGYRCAKFVRRNRVGVSMAAVIVVVLIGGIVGTWSGWQQADRAQHRASRMFTRGSTLAHKFIHDFSAKLEKLDGALPIQRTLVTDALAYLNGVSEDAGDDVGLLRELAHGYKRIGQIEHKWLGREGGVERALTSYTTAVELQQDVTARTDSMDDSLRLADYHLGVADVLKDMKGTDDAMAHAELAHDLADDVYNAHPENRSAQRLVARALLVIGDVYVSLQESSRADVFYQQSETLRRDLLSEDPTAVPARRDLAVVLTRRGQVSYNIGNFDDALASYQQALGLRRSLSAELSDDKRARADLLEAHLWVSNVHSALGHGDTVREHSLAAVAIGEDHATANALNADARILLGGAYQNLGDDLRDTKEFQAALDYYVKFLHLAEETYQLDKQSILKVKRVAAAHSSVGDALLELGRVEEAIESQREALDIRVDLRTQRPKDKLLLADIADSQVLLADALRRADRIQDAKDLLDTAGRSLDDLGGAESDDRYVRDTIYPTYIEIRDALRAHTDDRP